MKHIELLSTLFSLQIFIIFGVISNVLAINWTLSEMNAKKLEYILLKEKQKHSTLATHDIKDKKRVLENKK